MKVFKKYAVCLLCLVIILSSCSRSPIFNFKSVDTGRVMKTIEYLSSKDFNGRMAGTSFGVKTEEYVASKFKEAGLKPGGIGGTYFQSFTGTSGNASGEYALEVISKGKIIKQYKYATDYKYFMPFTNSGDVTSKGGEIDLAAGSIPDAGEAKIAILTSAPSSLQDPAFYSRLYNSGYRGLIVLGGTASSRIKGQRGVNDYGDGSKLPRVCVTASVCSELLKYSKEGYEIHLKSGFEVKNYSARNVIGILKPRIPSDRYLIISAHMDHLGPDPDGAYFPGALDNASGTSAIIEIARVLALQSTKPDINIVFIAFSGEEEMLDGSRFYVTNPIYPLKNTRVLNIDMIGSKSNLPVTILTSGTGKRSEEETDIKEEVESLAGRLKYPYEAINDGASDHAPFAQAGVPAVTLIDYEKKVYHVPEDNISNIGEENLKRDVTLAMNIIETESYDHKEASASFWVYPACAVIFASGLVFMYRRKKKIAK